MIFSVYGLEEVGVVRRAIMKYAHEMGFDKEEVGQLAIVVTELATNLVVHNAIEGEICFDEVHNEKNHGIEIISHDCGPGILNMEKALEDGYSTKNSFGQGLGTVRRLMDEFDISSRISANNTDSTEMSPELSGTVVTVRKWLVKKNPVNHFFYSVNSRPYPGMKINGDSYFIKEEHDSLFVAVVDGLGHGEKAHEASTKAIEFISNNHRKDFKQLFIDLHEALKKTRGVAATLVCVDLSNGILTHAGVGNVDMHLFPGNNSHLFPQPGIVGEGIKPHPRIKTIPWSSNNILAVFSDGISRRWDIEEIPDIHNIDVMKLCWELFQKYARVNDDATIVIAKEKS